MFSNFVLFVQIIYQVILGISVSFVGTRKHRFELQRVCQMPVQRYPKLTLETGLKILPTISKKRDCQIFWKIQLAFTMLMKRPFSCVLKQAKFWLQKVNNFSQQFNSLTIASHSIKLIIELMDVSQSLLIRKLCTKINFSI